eukprot:1394784-Amorphochlora_amoeboformis.AAC.1
MHTLHEPPRVISPHMYSSTTITASNMVSYLATTTSTFVTLATNYHSQIQCLRSRTPYILCPCCIGKLRKLAHPLPLDDTKKKKRPTHPPPVSLSAEFVLSHPRSLWMRGKISRERYARLARLADFHGFEGGSMEKAGDKGRGEEQMMREYIRY